MGRKFFADSKIFYSKNSTPVVVTWFIWLGLVTTIFLLPTPTENEAISLGMMSIAAAAGAVLMGLRSRKARKKEKQAWRILSAFYGAISLDSLSNAFAGGASTPPEIVLPLGCLLLTAIFLLVWDLLIDISRTRIFLDALWFSIIFLAIGWYLFVSPFLEIESTTLWDQLSFAATPTAGLIGVGLILSIIYQTREQRPWGFGFIGFSVFSLCIVTAYEILVEAKGETAFLEGYDYFWHLSLTLGGMSSQISLAINPRDLPENLKNQHLTWLTLAPVAIGLPVLLLSGPVEFRGPIIFSAIILTLLALRIIAIDKENNNLNNTLRTLALNDHLTNIPNRRGLINHMEKQRRHHNELGIVFIDLDGFKKINDIHGHESGDFVLKEVARRLESILRSGDFLARLGGDEFVVCTKTTSIKSLKSLANRLTDITNEPYTFPAGSAKIGLTTGIAISEKEMSTTALLDKADKRMLDRKTSIRI